MPVPVHARSAPEWTIPEVTAAIAHEVNQPLAAILTSAEAALRWLATDPPNLLKAQQAIERVIRNGRRAANVTKGVRDLIRKSLPVADDLDINDVIRDVLDLSSVDLHCHAITVEAELADGLKPVKGDRTQLERLVANLVANGIDAMSAVEDRQRKLRISTRTCEPGTVLVTVEDSGIGFDPAKVEHIFDPFFTTKRDGMGLGLSICRSIVEAHGGRLSATPKCPHGSAFNFILPASSQ